MSASTPVAPGTAAVGETGLVVPGPSKVVDHGLSRAGRRGSIAVVDSEQNPDVDDPKSDE